MSLRLQQLRKPSMTASIKHLTENYLAKWADASTIHGIRDVKISSSCPEKLTFLFVVLICLVLTFYCSRDILTSFIAGDTFFEFTVKPYDRPSVLNKVLGFVYCPTDWVNRTRVQELNISDAALIRVLAYLENNIFFVMNGFDGALNTALSQYGPVSWEFAFPINPFQILQETVRALFGEMALADLEVDQHLSVHNVTLFEFLFLIANRFAFQYDTERFNVTTRLTYRHRRICTQVNVNVTTTDDDPNFVNWNGDFQFGTLHKGVDMHATNGANVTVSPYVGDFVDAAISHAESEMQHFFGKQSPIQKNYLTMTTIQLEVTRIHHLVKNNTRCSNVASYGYREPSLYRIYEDCQATYCDNLLEHQNCTRALQGILRRQGSRVSVCNLFDHNYNTTSYLNFTQSRRCSVDCNAYRAHSCVVWEMPYIATDLRVKNRENSETNDAMHVLRFVYRGTYNVLTEKIVTTHGMMFYQLGGTAGLFIGASVISFIQMFVYCTAGCLRCSWRKILTKKSKRRERRSRRVRENI